MRQIRIFIVALFLALLMPAGHLFAVPAYNQKVTVSQPDGTSVDIFIHGDEFLHWTTSGGRLVTQGSDGFYYYAEFNSEGSSVVSGGRVAAKSSSTNQAQASVGNLVVPPASAVALALERRREWMESLNSSPTRAAGNGAPQKSAISTGNNRFLVLLIQFPDLAFGTPASHFDNLLNQKGFSENGGTGSVSDYYKDNSRGLFSPVFDVVGPYTAKNGYAYYGKSDSMTKDLLVEACKALDGQIDFSKYDSDGNGCVDNVFFYFAGYNEAEGGGTGTIWPLSWSVSDKGVLLDGKWLTNFACTSEYKGSSSRKLAGIGTFCHEFGHVLGLPDFYDTDYETNGSAKGLSNFSLMSSGNYNNEGRTPPFLNYEERLMLGWMSKSQLVSFDKSGSLALSPISDNVAYYLPSGKENEYFLFEARPSNAWDRYIGANGLVVYHVDKSNNSVHGMSASLRWSMQYLINCYSDHQCFDLVESVAESSASAAGDFVYPSRFGVNSIDKASAQPLRSWGGVVNDVTFNSISYSSGTVSLVVRLNQDRRISGYVFDSAGKAVVDAEVKLSSSSFSLSTVSDAKGFYEFSIADAGDVSCSLSVSCYGFLDFSEDVKLIGASLVKNVSLSNLPVDADGPFFALGLEYVDVLSELLSGTEVTLKLSKVETPCVSVQWFVDATPVSAASATATATATAASATTAATATATATAATASAATASATAAAAAAAASAASAAAANATATASAATAEPKVTLSAGTHTLKAVLTYADGHKKTIVKSVIVK